MSLRYDPRDMAEIRVSHEDSFRCERSSVPEIDIDGSCDRPVFHRMPAPKTYLISVRITKPRAAAPMQMISALPLALRTSTESVGLCGLK